MANVQPSCCPDTYLCPSSGDVECPRHGGFHICCDYPQTHIPTDRDLWHAAQAEYERDLLDAHIRAHLRTPKS